MSFSVNANPDITNDITYYLKNKALDRTTTNIGDIKWSAINHDSYGWLLCNGRILSRTQHRELFEIIGTQFGANVDEDSFYLPDCRSRVLGAIGQGFGLSNRSMGEQTGRETHTLIVSEIPAHDHTGTTGNYTHDHTGSTGNYSHDHGGITGNAGSAAESETVVRTVAAIHDDASVSGSGSHNHSIAMDSHTHSIASDTHAHSIASQGGSQPHNNMQPTLFIGNVFIFGGYQYNLNLPG